MGRTLTEAIDALPRDRRAKVEARAAELIAKELSLQQLRKAMQLTQVELADRLGVRQDTISRLEQRADMLLSTLRSYVEAIGGRLSIVAELPNRPPIRIRQISTLAGEAGLPEGYRAMAADKGRERDASEWVENLTGDIADEEG
jgi:transcriptional regulator with XRE-family HTH domain